MRVKNLNETHTKKTFGHLLLKSENLSQPKDSYSLTDRKQRGPTDCEFSGYFKKIFRQADERSLSFHFVE